MTLADISLFLFLDSPFLGFLGFLLGTDLGLFFSVGLYLLLSQCRDKLLVSLELVTSKGLLRHCLGLEFLELLGQCLVLGVTFGEFLVIFLCLLFKAPTYDAVGVFNLVANFVNLWLVFRLVLRLVFRFVFRLVLDSFSRLFLCWLVLCLNSRLFLAGLAQLLLHLRHRIL